MSYGRRILVLVLISVLILSILCGCKSTDPPAAPDPEPDPEPVVIVPELPGMLIAIVENHPAARPQSGLEQADIVYEMVSEGNITRFLACFYRYAPEKIGPVRSIRPPFSQVAKAYDSPLAFAGGSTAGLASIRDLRVQNLDEIHNASRYFYRASNRRRPHNLYTSSELMLAGAERMDYTLTPPPIPRTGVRLGGSPKDFLEVTYSRSARSPYATQFVYKEGQYYKKINQQPFLADSGESIVADNVIVMIIRTTYEQADGNTYANIHLVGSGEAYFFTQGKMFHGRWQKSSAASHFQYSVDGVPFLFEEGQTWVQIIPNLDALTYSYTELDEPEETED